MMPPAHSWSRPPGVSMTGRRDAVAVVAGRLGRQITGAAIPAGCPGPFAKGPSPGRSVCRNGVHRGADRTSACRAGGGPGSARRVALLPATPRCPRGLCDLRAASLLVIQATMINCPDLAGCRW